MPRGRPHEVYAWLPVEDRRSVFVARLWRRSRRSGAEGGDRRRRGFVIRLFVSTSLVLISVGLVLQVTQSKALRRILIDEVCSVTGQRLA